MIRAALFEGTTPVMLLKGSALQLNANTSPTRVWKEVSVSVKKLADVPPFAELPDHPEMVQREA